MPFRYRPDGKYVKNLPLTRRIMPFIMKGRVESTVYFEQNIDAEKAWKFLEKFRQDTGLQATILHLIIWAGGQILNERPKLNRFVAGKRIYQRNGIWVSFSAKKKMSENSPLVVIKREIDPGWTFNELVTKLRDSIVKGKSDKPSPTDKELSLVFKFPAMVVGLFSRLMMKLDHFGLVPGFALREDPMYASVIIANLGSIGLDAAYHHLYEYGNIPIFITVGKKEDRVTVAKDGSVTVRPILTLRFSFDERIADGFYCLRALNRFRQILEDPEPVIREFVR